MKRPIDADAAIDYFRHIIDATNTDNGYNNGFIDALEFCISTLSTMSAAERWIPLSEGLPEQYTDVAFAMKSQNGRVRYATGYWFKGLVHVSGGGIWRLEENKKYILAWMPIPEYKEEENDTV